MTDNSLSYSFVLMAFNQQDYVRDAVEALLAQDCPPIELLLSDDSSTDDTFAVMQDAVAGYDGPHRVVLNRNPVNLGVNRHIRHCYELCSGEVIIATSGDDFCHPDRARKTIEVFERDRPLLVFSQADVINLAGGPLPPNYRKALFYTTLDPLATAGSMSLYLGATCAWHKDLFRKYGPIKDNRCFEDLILGFRAALENRISFIDDELVTYRIGEGLSNKPFTLTSQAEYDARRLQGIARDIAVFEQRLTDCATYGLDQRDPIVGILERRLKERKLRDVFIQHGAIGVMRQPGASLKTKLAAVIYEAHKRRRVLKKAMKSATG